MMEIKSVNLATETFIEGLSILHIEIMTDDKKLQHAFLGVPKKYIEENHKYSLEEWLTKMHTFRLNSTTELVQKVIPKPDHGDNILFKKFD